MNRWLKLLSVPLLIAGLWYGEEWIHSPTKPDVTNWTHAQPVQLPLVPVTTPPKPSFVSQLVDRSVVVAGVRVQRSGSVYLETADGITIICRPGLVPSSNPRALIGSTLLIKGNTVKYRDGFRILASQVAQPSQAKSEVKS